MRSNPTLRTSAPLGDTISLRRSSPVAWSWYHRSSGVPPTLSTTSWVGRPATAGPAVVVATYLVGAGTARLPKLAGDIRSQLPLRNSQREDSVAAILAGPSTRTTPSAELTDIVSSCGPWLSAHRTVTVPE